MKFSSAAHRCEPKGTDSQNGVTPELTPEIGATGIRDRISGRFWPPQWQGPEDRRPVSLRPRLKTIVVGVHTGEAAVCFSYSVSADFREMEDDPDADKG
jgi:hypothetical protein